ncbi:MAG: hypothetical protein L3J34_13115 [Flavobacteriaceae bacterium]|nr:hypothetical protein [Flavobacteriaceae bacterium]
MRLERTILEHLNNNDNGNFIDITFVDENYSDLKASSELLNEQNLILIDKNSSRDFEAFGISNLRVKRLKAKIKMNGKIYLHTLDNKERELALKNKGKEKNRKFAYFFNF